MPQNTISADEHHVLRLVLPALLHERVRAYRTANHLESEEQAICDLIERGLEAEAAEPGAVRVSPGEREDRE
jgi:hypothetical protein